MHPRRKRSWLSRTSVQLPLLCTPLLLVGAMAIVSRAPQGGEGGDALLPEQGRSPGLVRTPSGRRVPIEAPLTRSASVAPEAARQQTVPAMPTPQPRDDSMEARYDGWTGAALAAEALRLEARLDEHAWARCSILLGTTQAENDVELEEGQEPQPEGVWVRGEGRRYRLDPTTHADLYTWKRELTWVREEAERRLVRVKSD